MRSVCDNNLNKLRNQFDSLEIDAIFLGMYNTFGNYESNISDIQYFSGFSGSNGRCFISKSNAIISVDGRYVKQAQAQVNNNIWQIVRYPDTSVVDIFKEIVQPNTTLGICLYSLKYNSYLLLLELSKKLNFNIKLLDEFPVIIRKLSNTKLLLLNNMGQVSVSNNINKIQDTLNDNEGLIITESSMVGWITGVRLAKPTSNHSLIPSAAVFITKHNKPVVFCDLTLDYNTDDFIITSLDDFEQYIKRSNIDTIKCNFLNTYLYFPYTLLQLQYNVVNDNFSSKMCSIKTPIEINNQKDGALLTSLAMIKVLAMAETNNIHSELEAINLFCQELSKTSNFVDFSFDPISAFGDNSSIIHYNPKSFSYNTNFTSDGLFLFDGGAHFKYSTTDMTRTIYIGNNPSNEVKQQYTLVLKSIIDFSIAKFPSNVKACSLDAIARSVLWNYGYNYSFGTGHGVSAFGNVHEYPSISTNSNHEILENMIVTIEPGIYTNNTGIRMENMLLIKHSEYSNYNEFETINYIPFSNKLIIKEMLSTDEMHWLNNYHSQVLNKCLDYFNDNELIKNWLINNTEPL
ncbi:MAG: M24 family metallopeptidase [Alphaproteobacteria bacterium]|nr:M24 family metallopeptidase [Alphaproteobacteria bacterium]